MIKIEKNTLQQEVWFPRTERGDNVFRKTYQDGFDDGYQDGLASQKVKLYDGMKLAYSTIGSLDDFDFSEVKNYSNMFRQCKMSKGEYDFNFVGIINHSSVLEETDFNGSEKVTYTVSKVNYFLDASVNNVKNFYYNITEPMTDSSLYSVMYSFGKIENYYFNADTSQCPYFNSFISLYNCKNLYLNILDMSKESNTNANVIRGDNYENIYINAQSPRLTLERLRDNYVKNVSNPKAVFHFGKERWTYDTIKKEWVLSGYDD